MVKNLRKKIVIYQVLPRLFGNTNKNCIPNSSYEINGSGKLESFTKEVLKNISSLGCTHIWYTGVIEHATKCSFPIFSIYANHPSIVKGIAGSPYSIIDYYDISPTLSIDIPERINEFKALVSRSHECNLKVIIDFIPNHLSREYHSDAKPKGIEDFGERDLKNYPFHPMNNFYYLENSVFVSPAEDSSLNKFIEAPAKATGNDCFVHNPSLNDWFETVKLNYGVDYTDGHKEYFYPIPETWIKMEDVLIYWLKTGVDGFRCDMAGMVPVEFWSWVTKRIRKQFPDTLFIGEIYDPGRYCEYFDKGGFDYLYDKVGLYDTLKAVIRQETGAGSISRCWQLLGESEDRMVNFLENHDEQRIASDFFAGDPLKAIPALVVSLMLNRSAFMIYFGQELGERGMDAEGYSEVDGRSSIFDFWSVRTVREWLTGESNPGIREIYKKLLNIAIQEVSINRGEKYDLQFVNPASSYYNPDHLFSFIRSCEDSFVLAVVNFSNKYYKAAVKIPSEALAHLKLLDESVYKTENLLTNGKGEYYLSSNKNIEVEIGEYGVYLIKFSL